MMMTWILLIGSLAGAIFFSCMCSLLEAALLSLTPSQLASLRQDHGKVGEICQKLKRDIEKPIAVILIVISMILTLFAGIIPSRSAAKKDPVVALRTE